MRTERIRGQVPQSTGALRQFPPTSAAAFVVKPEPSALLKLKMPSAEPDCLIRIDVEVQFRDRASHLRHRRLS